LASLPLKTASQTAKNGGQLAIRLFKVAIFAQIIVNNYKKLCFVKNVFSGERLSAREQYLAE